MMSELGINELEADRGTRKKICITVGGVYSIYYIPMHLLNTGLHFDRGQGGGGRGGWGDAEVELEISLFDYFMNIL